MEPSLPRYLVAPSDSSRQRLQDLLKGLEPLVEITSVDALLSGEERDPGWVFLAPDLPAGELLRLLRALGDRPGPWSPVALLEEEGQVRALPLSPGFTESLGRVKERLQEGGSEQAILSFRHALDFLATARHDINNPLTAALAEAQLLLMDAEQGSEEARALQTVEEQIRRIRDLVSDLRALRPPQA